MALPPEFLPKFAPFLTAANNHILQGIKLVEAHFFAKASRDYCMIASSECQTYYSMGDSLGIVLGKDTYLCR